MAENYLSLAKKYATRGGPNFSALRQYLQNIAATPSASSPGPIGGMVSGQLTSGGVGGGGGASAGVGDDTSAAASLNPTQIPNLTGSIGDSAEGSNINNGNNLVPLNATGVAAGGTGGAGLVSPVSNNTQPGANLPVAPTYNPSWWQNLLSGGRAGINAAQLNNANYQANLAAQAELQRQGLVNTGQLAVQGLTNTGMLDRAIAEAQGQLAVAQQNGDNAKALEIQQHIDTMEAGRQSAAIYNTNANADALRSQGAIPTVNVSDPNNLLTGNAITAPSNVVTNLNNTAGTITGGRADIADQQYGGGRFSPQGSLAATGTQAGIAGNLAGAAKAPFTTSDNGIYGFGPGGASFSPVLSPMLALAMRDPKTGALGALPTTTVPNPISGAGGVNPMDFKLNLNPSKGGGGGAISAGASSSGANSNNNSNNTTQPPATSAAPLTSPLLVPSTPSSPNPLGLNFSGIVPASPSYYSGTPSGLQQLNSPIVSLLRNLLVPQPTNATPALASPR